MPGDNGAVEGPEVRNLGVETRLSGRRASKHYEQILKLLGSGPDATFITARRISGIRMVTTAMIRIHLGRGPGLCPKSRVRGYKDWPIRLGRRGSWPDFLSSPPPSTGVGTRGCGGKMRLQSFRPIEARA